MAINYLYFGILATMLILAGCVSQPTADETADHVDEVPHGDETPHDSEDVMENKSGDARKDKEGDIVTGGDTIETNKSGDAMESKVNEITLTAKQFKFEPSTFTAKKGEAVKLIINSIDVTHGFEIPDFGVSETLTPGTTTIVEFTPDKTGDFTFFCNIFCGSGHSGMTGTFTVTE